MIFKKTTINSHNYKKSWFVNNNLNSKIINKTVPNIKYSTYKYNNRCMWANINYSVKI